jgi:hypothetical protein
MSLIATTSDPTTQSQRRGLPDAPTTMTGSTIAAAVAAARADLEALPAMAALEAEAQARLAAERRTP